MDLVEDDRPKKRIRPTTTNSSLANAIDEIGAGLQVAVPRAVPNAWNDRFTVELDYVDQYRSELAFGTPYSQLWRVTSIFDPDYTGTGHQPFGRDLWASMYNYYSVIKCDYELHIMNLYQDSTTYTGAGASSNILAAISADLNHSTSAADFGLPYPTSAEAKGVQHKILPPVYRFVDGNSAAVSFKGSLTSGDFRTEAKDMDSDTTWTAIGANPAIARFLGITLNSIIPSAPAGLSETTVFPFLMEVKLRYTVQFAEVNTTTRTTGS